MGKRIGYGVLWLVLGCYVGLSAIYNLYQYYTISEEGMFTYHYLKLLKPLYEIAGFIPGSVVQAILGVAIIFYGVKRVFGKKDDSAVAEAKTPDLDKQ
jgi:hypothetical protein